MQTKEKYSDRRRHQRRHGDRRCDRRRHNARLNLSKFEILLPDQNGETINVSASGVYFEVATNDMAFSPGTIIPLQINTVTTEPYSKERKLKLTGKGLVIRNCIIENPEHENSLGVAFEIYGVNLILDLDSD